MTVETIPAPAEAPTVQPGVYDIPAEQYHADPIPGGSLSSSGARKLLPPSCPALFKYEQDHQRPYKRTFDLGHAAHQMVLGAGPELVVVDRDRWDTNDCKAEVAEIRARGAVPLKPHDHAVVTAMAAALRAHPTASALLNPELGRPEQSLFWVDQRTGMWLRARPDFLRFPTAGRALVPDYKTCVSAAPDKIQKAIYDHGYYMQAPFYLDGLRALGLAGPDAVFLFIFQEKTPPYLVTVAQPDPTAVAIGQFENRAAIDLYAECRSAGRWPGYTDDIALISLPRYVENQYGKELSW